VAGLDAVLARLTAKVSVLPNVRGGNEACCVSTETGCAKAGAKVQRVAAAKTLRDFGNMPSKYQIQSGRGASTLIILETAIGDATTPKKLLN